MKMASLFTRCRPTEMCDFSTLVRDPFHPNGSVHDERHDGWRIVTSKDGEHLRLVSRNGRDRTQRFACIVWAICTYSPILYALAPEDEFVPVHQP